MLDNGKAEARAARLARAAAVHAVEALGKPRDVLGLDADAAVLDRKRRAGFRSAPDQPDFTAVGRVADGVGYQVTQRAGDFAFGAEEIPAALCVQADAVAAAGERFRVGTQADEDRFHRDLQVPRGLGRGFECGERQQVVDDALHAARLIGHHAHVVARPVRIQFQFPHGFEKAADYGERRSQLVRHVGDEVAPHGFQSFRLGYVAREQQLLRIVVGNDLNRKRKGRAPAGFQPDGAGVIALRQVFHELGLPDQVRYRLPHVRVGVDAETRLGLAVAPDDPVVAIQDHHAVGQRAPRLRVADHQARQTLALLRKMPLAPMQQGESVVPDTARLGHLARIRFA